MGHWITVWWFYITDALIQNDIKFPLTFIQGINWGLRASLKGPSSGNLAGLGFELRNSWAVVQWFNHWATTNPVAWRLVWGCVVINVVLQHQHLWSQTAVQLNLYRTSMCNNMAAGEQEVPLLSNKSQWLYWETESDPELTLASDKVTISFSVRVIESRFNKHFTQFINLLQITYKTVKQ